MNTNPRSRFLRITLYLLLACIAILSGWLLYDTNPNTRFHRLQRDFANNNTRFLESSQSTDPLLPIINSIQLQQQEAFYTNYWWRLQNDNPDALNAKNRAVHTKMKHEIAEQLAQIRALQHDPSLFNLGGALKATLAKTNISLEERLRRIETQLHQAKNYYQAAKENLKNPDPAKTALAVQKQLRTITFLNTELLDSIKKAQLVDYQKDLITTQSQEAKIAVKDYLAFCRSFLFEQRDSMQSQ